MFINVKNNGRVIYFSLIAGKAKEGGYSLFVVILWESCQPPSAGKTALQVASKAKIHCGDSGTWCKGGQEESGCQEWRTVTLDFDYDGPAQPEAWT